MQHKDPTGIRVVFALCVAAVAWITACNPGQVAPGGYNCATPSTGPHCYAIAGDIIGRPKANAADQSSEIFGYSSNITVTTDMAPGDGFINDEMWLRAEDGPGWIEAGYIDDQFSQHYFWAENDENSGIFVSHMVAPVSSTDTSVLVQILNNGKNKQTSDDFLVVLVSTNASGTNNMAWDSGPITNAMWSVGFDQWAEINFGQELAGSSGARANTVVFVNNRWLDSNGIWRFQTDDMSLAAGAPPYDGWIQTPSVSQSNGGAFFTECCLAP